MMNYGDTRHQNIIKENEISRHKNFTYAETQFNVAIGVSNKFGLSKEMIDIDERYVQIFAKTVENTENTNNRLV